MILALTLVGSGPLARADEPVPVPSAVPSAAPSVDPRFLQLPAYDLEWQKPAGAPAGGKENAKPTVGDLLDLKGTGLNLAPGQKITIMPVPSSGDLTDQGWKLAASAEPGHIIAVPIKPGALTLPSLAIVDPTGEGKAIGRTNPFSVTVDSAIRPDDPKPQQPADLRPPVGLGFPWWVAVVGAILVVLLAGLGIWGYRRWFPRRRPVAEKSAPTAPPRPEHEVALEALAQLEGQRLVLKGRYKPHYFGVSEILKNYLGARYRFDAPESTSKEILRILEDKQSLTDELLDELEALFDKLDLVKFTDHAPQLDEGAWVLAEARKFVQATRKPPEPMKVAEYATQ